MRVLLTFIKKELIQATRDRRMRFILFGAPLMQLILFGYVVTTDIKNITLLVIDHEQSVASREFTESFFSSGYFTRSKIRIASSSDAERLLLKDKIKVVIIIPPDFSRNLARDNQTKIQILVDGSDGNAANITKAYIDEIIANYSKKVLFQILNSRTGISQLSSANKMLVTPEIRVLYNPALKSSTFMVPGIICQLLLIVTAVLSGASITKEKELGTIEQIFVSPLNKMQFILGKTIPFVLVGLLDVILILIMAKILFQIPINGSLLLFFFVAIIFLFTSLGIGLIAASVSRTQAQVSLTIFPFMMPAFLLSGLFFPIASIPISLRWISYINPLTYFLIIVRGILLKGAGLAVLYKEIIFLALFGIFFIAFSSFRFRKRLE
jgi:ABC-2 type transport system permease protein